MALINCPECGKEISDQAVSCPNCGTPINIQKKEQKYCKHCGEQIDKECVICPKCGKQVEDLNTTSNDKNIIINNNNSASSSATAVNTNPYGVMPKPKNKWVAFFLCLFLGVFGIHKFYEGKILMGIVYICTGGCCGIGVIIDLILLLMKPNPYYV